MKSPANNWSCLRPGRRARKAFTFIELVVAIALSVVLLRGIYTIFHSATSLSMLSEQKMVTMLDMAAVFDYISDDVARSPTASDDYYLDITDGGEGARTSIKFQMLRIDGAVGMYVYVRYYLDGTDLKRQVFGNDMTTPATTEIDGEDGTEITVARNISSFEVYYFNNTKNKIDATDAWTLLDAGDVDLTGAERTWALKFEVTIDDSGLSAADLGPQDFTLIFPVMH